LLESVSTDIYKVPYFETNLQRIFNTRLKIVACCFLLYFWTFQQKPYDYISSGCKNMVSQKYAVLLGHPVYIYSFAWVMAGRYMPCT